MKQFVVILFLVFFVQSYAQKLQTYSFEEVEHLVEKQPRPILLYFHTDWCRFCKMMDRTTFSDPKIIEKLNEKYYFISFNAGTKEAVRYKNEFYHFIPKGRNSGHHELVHHFLKNRQEIHPTLIFLDADFNETLFLQSYISSREMLGIL